jgi:3'-phosphoadenosine 5'-phosphosulfate (PAPS) 3'-phosphatase
MATDIATTQDGGVSNLAVGSFTGAGEAVSVTTGFKPRYIKLINLTDRIVHEWTYDMAATHTLNTAADGTMTDNTGSHLVAKGGQDDFRGFLVAAAAAVNAKLYHYIAFG